MSIMSEMGLRPNKLTNTWVPFVIGAALSLNEGGRLAFVLPAEVLQVTYAAQLRKFLAKHFQRIHIFACNHLVFHGAEQETVLLLADSYSPRPLEECLIEMVETHGLAELLAARPNHKHPSQYSTLDHASEKWLKFFLRPEEIGLMRALRVHVGVAHLRHHANVDVGVVTGRNEFFVISKRKIAEFDLGEYVVPLVGRSSQLRGAIVDREEWQSFADNGQDVYLLTTGNPKNPPLNAGARRYIKIGESAKFHLGYKCSIREPWFSVPSVWVPDCFLFRQIYDFPRGVLNDAKAVSTDTVHRMRCRNPTDLLENIYTHMTAASAEIEGRSYGGGVLELEPTEAERLLTPRVLNGAMPIKDADRLVRKGRIDEVLAQNDKLVLQKSLGLSKTDCAMLKRIWTKMRDRRMSRRRP
jgi:adenine-specific DNA methylase